MFGVSGRTMVVVLLGLCLAVVLVLGLHEAGFTWGTSTAARQAVVTALAQVPREVTVARPDPQVPGKNANAEEAAALDQAVNAFLAAVQKREFAAAWEMIDPERRGVWTEEDWAQLMDSYKPDEVQSSGGEEMFTLMMDHAARVGEVKTWGESGVARVIVTLKLPQWLAFVRRGGNWALDLQATEDLQARESVGEQVKSFSRAGETDFFRLIMSMESDSAWSDYLALVQLAPQSASYETVLRKVEGDKAVVKLAGQAELHLAVAVERSETGWSPDWNDVTVLAGPDAPLQESMAGELSVGPVGASCLSNLKQVGLAMLAYSQDYDEKMPPADKWSTVSFPYVRNTQIYQCPAVPGKYGYAMNYKLSRMELGKIEMPAETVGNFDSTLLRPNAYDKGQQAGASVTWPPRHDDVINYVYVDGHAEAEREPLTYPYYYQVVRSAPGAWGPGGPMGGPGGPPGGYPPPPPPPAY